MAKRTRKKVARRKTGLGVADFRRVALSMPEAQESAHMGRDLADPAKPARRT